MVEVLSPPVLPARSRFRVLGRFRVAPAARPLVFLLAGYPVWWLLGLGVLIFPLAAVPVAAGLCRRRVAIPPEVGLWLLFLLTAVIGVAALGVDPAGTMPASVGARLPGLVFRLIEYGALTVLLLGAVGLTARELPQRTLVALLAGMFLLTVAGGLLGMVAPRLQLTSPVELLLPGHARSNEFVKSLVHPSAAQVSDVLGYSSPRPAAPWGYTNTWGNNLALTVPWFVVAALAARGRRRWAGWAAALVLVAAVAPVISSLNRGLWIDLAAAAVFVAVRLAARGRWAPVGALAGAVLLAALLVVLSPLGGLVRDRMAHQDSNSQRGYTTERALAGIGDSPVIGLGTTRNSQGSAKSITVGGSATCKRCGSHTVGANGQLWQVLYLHGIVGTALYIGFFGAVLWRHRRDTSPVGLAGQTTIVVSLASMFWYNSLVTPLAFTFLGCAALWRNTTKVGVAR